MTRIRKWISIHLVVFASLFFYINISWALNSFEKSSIVTPSFYVSPSGSDTNDGSLSMPFLTLERAQSAMEKSPVKTTYLMGGTYVRSAALALRPIDKGESWIAYPGQKPVLDGGDKVDIAISISGDSIKIRWLTIQNYKLIGIHTQNVFDISIEDNTIKNISSTAFNQGGIVMVNNLTHVYVGHNSIENTRYAGIMYANSAGDNLTDLVVDSNAVYNTCTHISDCGAIYADDRSHSTKGIIIKNNIIGNHGSASNQSKAIYMDDQLSYTTVQDNIVYGSWSFAIQYHGGDHNVVRNNIFDISASKMLGLYQYDGPTAKHFGMSGNTFTCNIVYSSVVRPGELWENSLTQLDTPLTNYNNLYWSKNGKLVNTKDPIDALPTVSDPGFVDPDMANYNFKSKMPPEFCNFHPINVSQVGPRPN
jgi:hypothetical protein